MVIALPALPVAAYAQEATIAGTVTDTTGGVLPGVTATAVHEASGISFEAVTDGGVFRMPARIGTYRFTATLAGFGDAARTGVNVARPDAADGIAYQPRTVQIGFRTRFWSEVGCHISEVSP